jgi:hypothetical protein
MRAVCAITSKKSWACPAALPSRAVRAKTDNEAIRAAIAEKRR